MLPYKLVYTSAFIRDFDRLEDDIQDRIIVALRRLQEHPFHGTKKLENVAYGKFRIRVGDYRIRYDLERKMIVLHSVKHRKDIYKDI